MLAVFALNTLTYANMIYSFDIFNNQKYENDPRLTFTLTISDEGLVAGRHTAGLRFDNSSAISSSITDIYFDAHPDTGSSLIFDGVSIIEGTGVSFSKGASPQTLPGGEMLTPKFDKTPEYSADSDSPVSPSGINPNEWLKLVFTLKTERNINDLIAEIAAGGSATATNLRVGIHIQSLPAACGSDSASAINCALPIQPIPEPATICLLGLGALSLIRRKKH